MKNGRNVNLKNIINSIYIKYVMKRERKNHPNPIKEWPHCVVSRKMGCDRGTPIDRYYIEKYLNLNKNYITGNVMEIGDSMYTMKYGLNLETSYIFTADLEYKSETSKVIYGDLQSGNGCEKEVVDCFILTQTLPFIYDIHSAAKNIVNMLRSGGTAILTVSGVSMISEYDNSRWGHFWGFTETSLRKLFEDISQDISIEITSMGNAKTASAFLYGLSVEDLEKADFDSQEDLVPLMIGALIKKY